MLQLGAIFTQFTPRSGGRKVVLTLSGRGGASTCRNVAFSVCLRRIEESRSTGKDTETGQAYLQVNYETPYILSVLNVAHPVYNFCCCFRTFFMKSALPINEDLRKQITKNLKSPQCLDPPVTLFDEAQTQVEYLINTTTYPNFLKSDVYLQYLQVFVKIFHIFFF